MHASDIGWVFLIFYSLPISVHSTPRCRFWWKRRMEQGCHFLTHPEVTYERMSLLGHFSFLRRLFTGVCQQNLSPEAWQIWHLPAFFCPQILATLTRRRMKQQRERAGQNGWGRISDYWHQMEEEKRQKRRRQVGKRGGIKRRRVLSSLMHSQEEEGHSSSSSNSNSSSSKIVCITTALPIMQVLGKTFKSAGQKPVEINNQ